MRYMALVGLLLLLFGQTGCSRKNGSERANADTVATVGKATEGDRSEARGYLDKGKDHYRNDEDTQAAEAFLQATKLNPELAEAHFRLGLTYDALGQPQEAEEAYKKAVENYKKYLSVDEQSNDAEAHYNLGQTYSGLHLYTEAVREYRQATRLKPDDAAIHYDLGQALMRLAQYDEAVLAFAKSLELDPENYRAEDELAEAREGVMRIRAGKKHQEELLKKKKEEEELKKEEGMGAVPSSTPASSP